MSTCVIACPRTRRVGVILLVVVLGLLLCFLWKSKHFIRMTLVENPETCVLCDEFARDVPCLLGWTITTEQTDKGLNVTISQ